MNRFIKKIIAVATVFTVLSFVGGPAFALTAEELQAQINALLAQLSTLQSQLATLTGGTGTISCTIASFTSNLSQGSSGEEVRCLQKVLNSDAATQVASSGAGSPGSETTYFGPLTYAAVITFQNKYAPTILTPLGLTSGTGFVGAATRAKLNTMLGGTYVPPTGCTTNAQCATGYVCQTGTCVRTSTTGTEGSFTATLASDPADATYTAGLDRAVYGIIITAYNSDITLNRVDLQMTVTAAAVVSNPVNFVTGVKVYDGSSLLLTVVNPVFTQDANYNYFTQIAGINALVPKGTSKTIVFKVDTTTSIDVARTLAVQPYGANAIRGTDTTGLSTYATIATARNLTFNVPGQGTLTATVSTSTPVSANLFNDATDGTLNVTLFKFSLKATAGDVTLKRLGVNMASNTASYILPTVIRLYDGDTLVSSASDTTTRDIATFENFSLPIAKDATKTMTIKADFLPVDSTTNTNLTNNNIAVLQIPITGANSIYERATGAQVNTTVAAAFASNAQYLFRTGVKITFVSGTATNQNLGLDSDSVTGILKFRVEAFGATMNKILYASAASATPLSVTVLAFTPTGAVVATGATRSIVANPDDDTPDGSTTEYTITQSVSDATSTDVGQVLFKIMEVDWAMGALATEVVQGYGTGNMTDNWKTNYGHLY